MCIIVLPDVLAEAQAVLSGRFLSHRTECEASMHSWVEVASFAAIFREAEQPSPLSSSGFARARTIK
jgi:hypothetical protein